jgi:hypothetical protein
MLTQDKIISIFCIIDDILQQINHKEDTRRKVSDREIMLTALISACNFSGNQYKAMVFMKHYGFIPNMLDKSRFNRRFHQIKELFYLLFSQISGYLKDISRCRSYIIDSFPVSFCDNIRIIKSRLVNGSKWRGYTASMRRYFYGIKVQLVTTG